MIHYKKEPKKENFLLKPPLFSLYTHCSVYIAKTSIMACTASTHLNQTYKLVAANDVLLDSSLMKYSPTDCQRPEVLNKKLIEGNILLCGYSFNFVVGTASIKKVSETAKTLGAAGFVLCVENVSPGTKFDPVPVGLPGILIIDVSNSQVLRLIYTAIFMLW